jgi:hypothetical protein
VPANKILSPSCYSLQAAEKTKQQAFHCYQSRSRSLTNKDLFPLKMLSLAAFKPISLLGAVCDLDVNKSLIYIF